jgi:hypothetical protein
MADALALHDTAAHDAPESECRRGRIGWWAPRVDRVVPRERVWKPALGGFVDYAREDPGAVAAGSGVRANGQAAFAGSTSAGMERRAVGGRRCGGE